VNFGLWVDIPKGNGMLILSNELCAKRTTDNLAKNTIHDYLGLNPRLENCHAEWTVLQLRLALPLKREELKIRASPFENQMHSIELAPLR
jgi:hypothetical protein